ncbi:hypothetical protein [Campylobacter ureolyticus]|uniref:Uncharacterized protein n=1 Tax=Campylobacter ureolyticus TaxID=827 RepID=A0A9Q4PW39_9BACT|nr:hypothetical protein [Campylobacter ureolyticus]MCZ6160090.1 hypothetical protein [Campylobacter ureolyticus]MCZ6163711.1 hypothetical protein [Campylobacter ureolyticus]MCZ6165673.1 hypothetical protein [Campylobacter ureolyticus]MCZ6167347.1 hypothetical protein [Campylobacter ureolyticus]
MATNKELQDFYDTIHCELKPNKKNKYYIIEEEAKASLIKQIYIKNNGNTYILRQKENKCKAIQELFKDKNLESCDFIIIINMNKNFKVFFCEIKSNKSEEKIKKAKSQIKTSKIFFKYLLEAYNFSFNKNINLKIENADEILIYPKLKFANSQKSHTNMQKTYGLKYREIECNNKKQYSIDDAKKFFD